MDIARLRELAGLPRIKSQVVTEAMDDDEDPDAKIAASDKRQKEFEKKNAKELSAAEKAAKERVARQRADAEAKKAAKAEEKKEEPKAEEKKEEPKAEAKAEEKKETAAEEAKRKGRKVSERGGSCRQWLADHPGSTRSQFIAHCETHGMSRAAANTLFYSVKKKSATNEAWMVFHPSANTFVLAENHNLHRYQWMSLNEDELDGIEPLVFESKKAATQIASEFDSLGYTPGVITQVLKDDELVA